MRRIVIWLAASLFASGAAAQVQQTGSVFVNGSYQPPQPTTIYLQSCNAGIGGIVGQGTCTLSSGGGGGAVTIADGADVTLGSKADAAGATGSQTLISITKQLHLDLAAPLPAGTNLIGGFNLVQIQGAAPSITNPLWIANAEAGDTTGTFTNGTQTTSVTNSAADGYAAALISINGTYGTASGVFEASDDAGVTYYAIQCVRSDFTALETGYTSISNVNRQWICPVAGNDAVRVRSTAVASGTANVRVGITAPPAAQVTASSVQGLVPDGTANTSNPVIIGGTSDGTATGTANVAKVDANGNLFVSTGAASTTGAIGSFRQTSTTSAVALTSTTATNGVQVCALSTNAGTLDIGGSGVTTSTGTILPAGVCQFIPVANANQIFIVGSDTSEVVSVLAQ